MYNGRKKMSLVYIEELAIILKNENFFMAEFFSVLFSLSYVGYLRKNQVCFDNFVYSRFAMWVCASSVISVWL